METRKVIFYLLTLIFIIIAVFSILFYSNFLANSKIIIDLRNVFFTKLDRITPKGLFIYKPRAIKIDPDSRFIYKFPGKFQSMDFEKETITLKDMFGKSWTFKYHTNKREDGLKVDKESIDYRYVIKELGKADIAFLQKMTIDTNNPNLNISHFQKDDLIILFWSDSRKFTEILYANNLGETIELNGARMVQINKILWK